MRISPEGRVGILLALLGVGGVGLPMVAPSQPELGWVFIGIAVLGYVIMAVHHARSDESAERKSGYARRMVAFYGMIASAIGLISFGAAYFWPSQEEENAGVPAQTLIPASLPVDRYRNEGELVPGHWPNPDFSDLPGPIPPGGFVLSYGNSLAVSFGGPLNVIEMAGEKVLVLKRDPISGNLVILTLRLFDSENKIIARIDENGFWVRPDTRKKWPDNSTLLVYDFSDVEVLKLRFLNKNAVSIEGIFRHKDSETVTITPDYTKVNNMIVSKTISATGSVLVIDRPPPKPN